MIEINCITRIYCLTSLGLTTKVPNLFIQHAMRNIIEPNVFGDNPNFAMDLFDYSGLQLRKNFKITFPSGKSDQYGLKNVVMQDPDPKPTPIPNPDPIKTPDPDPTPKPPKPQPIPNPDPSPNPHPIPNPEPEPLPGPVPTPSPVPAPPTQPVPIPPPNPTPMG